MKNVIKKLRQDLRAAQKRVEDAKANVASKRKEVARAEKNQAAAETERDEIDAALAVLAGAKE